MYEFASGDMPRSQNVTSSGASQKRHVCFGPEGSMSLLVMPALPRCRALVPQAVEIDLVPHGVHSVPEALVLVRDELLVLGQALERLALKDRVVVRDVVEDGRLGDEISAVDPPAVAPRLLF